MPENKEVRKLELCDIAPYLPYQLKVWHRRHSYPKEISDKILTPTILCYVEHGGVFTIKPYLRSLDQLTQEITHNGEKLVFTELFEIGDDGGYNYEFDFGNVKLIKHLKKIAEHNIIADIPYLPHQVIKEMLKYHFDISGLCDSGLAIPIHNTK